MDVKEVFDSLARQEGPPSTTNVNRAMATGRARRRRRRAAVAATSAVGVAAAVVLAWSVRPWSERQNSIVAALPTAPSAEVTITVTPRPGRGFVELKKKHPPKGKIASVPPLVMWVSDAPRKGELFLCESGPNGSSCSGFPPLTKEFARIQGKLRGKAVWFGIAKDDVHGVTAVTKDGRRLQANLTRNVGPGLGLWAIEYPPETDVLRLVITDAKGKTLQKITV
ncbi:hypothetical protein ACIHFD_56780 [Nonomuraea sp. NPDC051941]|uniref:hypothetical protein n=1 Tax=Nonomuraea sp. NPDC051941 TaxID=3364373 RepID=UPI0037C7023A